MKKLILITVGLGAITALGFLIVRKPAAMTQVETAAEAVQNQPAEGPPPVQPIDAGSIAAGPAALDSTAVVDVHFPSTLSKPGPVAASAHEVRPGFAQAIQTLVLTQATFEQKQAAWKQLREAGQLDQAIGELEQRVASSPQSVDDMTSLGEAYWKKCAQIKDIREQAILVMKADQTFDAALNLDPSNWEARYTKALAMSHWPQELNKGDEVIAQFTTLIQQQEAATQQPHFAQAYIRLGDQYQKAGNLEYASTVWQRGAAFFPDNTELKEKLASPQTEQKTASTR
jgi:tetratricopeptide (TPR) repeat protein